MFFEIKLPSVHPPLIWCDNESAVALAQNPVYHSRTKHVELDLHFIRDKVLNHEVVIQHVSSRDQIADLLIKPLSFDTFSRVCSKLNVVLRPP